MPAGGVGTAIGSPEASWTYCGAVVGGGCIAARTGSVGAVVGVGVAARGTGIGSLAFDATIACSTFDGGTTAPPGGVRRDGRGLRSSLTAGAWILAASAAGGDGGDGGDGLTLGRAGSVV